MQGDVSVAEGCYVSCVRRWRRRPSRQTATLAAVRIARVATASPRRSSSARDDRADQRLRRRRRAGESDALPHTACSPTTICWSRRPGGGPRSESIPRGGVGPHAGGWFADTSRRGPLTSRKPGERWPRVGPEATAIRPGVAATQCFLANCACSTRYVCCARALPLRNRAVLASAARIAPLSRAIEIVTFSLALGGLVAGG